MARWFIVKLHSTTDVRLINESLTDITISHLPFTLLRITVRLMYLVQMVRMEPNRNYYLVRCLTFLFILVV